MELVFGGGFSRRRLCPEEVVSGGGFGREVFSFGGSVSFGVGFSFRAASARSVLLHRLCSFPFLPHLSSCVHRNRLSVLSTTHTLRTISDV
jgi:hypothetical protein